MSTYRALSEVPPLVERARQLAASTGFMSSCSDETGRLLRVLAAQVRDGVVGEIGTGCGVGAAWILSGLAPAVRLVTVELDPERAATTRQLFSASAQVRVLHDDWPALLPHGSFALLFADGGRAKQRDPERLLAALRPGGVIVLDDLTPEALWPPEWAGRRDEVRDVWLNQPSLAAAELLTSPAKAVIVGTRL